jgi:hypothetical protein
MLGAFWLVIAAPSLPTQAQAQSRHSALLEAQLTPAQLQAYRTHLAARADFDRQLEMYWALTDERRDHRRRKRAAQQVFVAADYVAEPPPKYAGPAMPADVAKIIDSQRQLEPDKPMPGVADFLANARAHFGFVPTPTSERDFKRRYASDALHYGLNKTQVVRVYALETGGDGTYDMQSGFHPVTRQGRPISSALGYAQLLGANSINELVKHGEGFAQRLLAMAAAPGATSQQAAAWQAKADVVRRMLAVARSVPNEWKDYQRLAQTPQGLGIHTLNLDAEIGPWLQVLKLKGIVDTAAKEAGRTTLTGGELELMNLAGPRTGLEMMEPVGRTMPTSNFFAQSAYYRNSIAREKSGAELLKALDDKMDTCVKKPGSLEFLAAFDEVLTGQPTRRAQVGDQPIPFAGGFDQAR